MLVTLVAGYCKTVFKAFGAYISFWWQWEWCCCVQVCDLLLMPCIHHWICPWLNGILRAGTILRVSGCWQRSRPLDAFGGASQNPEVEFASGYYEQERYVKLNLVYYQLCKLYSIDPHIVYFFPSSYGSNIVPRISFRSIVAYFTCKSALYKPHWILWLVRILIANGEVEVQVYKCFTTWSKRFGSPLKKGQSCASCWRLMAYTPNC